MRSGTGRRVVAGAVLVIVAGSGACSPEDRDPDSTDATRTPSSSRPSDTDSATPTSPPPTRPEPYRPHPAEVDGPAKRTAARAVEALPGVRAVTYTQYFGYLPPQASILVEATRAGGGTTYDVRISRSGEGWRVDSVTPAERVPAVDDPGPWARRVLASDRITLPAAARVDVAAGLVSDTVLRSMLAVAEHHRIGISVLISAHPVNVFGTDRRSHHPDGLAYDIGRVDGRLVVDPAAAASVRRVMRLAAGTGADQVGGPVDLDAGGPAYFSDLTHSDHVHVGFDG